MADTQRSILITGCSTGIGYDAAHTLAKRGWYVPGKHLVLRMASCLAASGTMGLALWYMLQERAVSGQILYQSALGDTLVFIAAGGAVYAVSALVFGAVRVSDIRSMLRRG